MARRGRGGRVRRAYKARGKALSTGGHHGLPLAGTEGQTHWPPEEKTHGRGAGLAQAGHALFILRRLRASQTPPGTEPSLIASPLQTLFLLCRPSPPARLIRLRSPALLHLLLVHASLAVFEPRSCRLSSNCRTPAPADNASNSTPKSSRPQVRRVTVLVHIVRRAPTVSAQSKPPFDSVMPASAPVAICQRPSQLLRTACQPFPHLSIRVCRETPPAQEHFVNTRRLRGSRCPVPAPETPPSPTAENTEWWRRSEPHMVRRLTISTYPALRGLMSPPIDRAMLCLGSVDRALELEF